MESFFEILENKNINNTNFFSIYKFLNDKNVSNNIPKYLYNDNYFLENFYIFDNLINTLIKRDSLFRYRLIDFFKEDEANINEKKKRIEKIYKLDINFYKQILNFSEKSFEIEEGLISLYNEFEVNKDLTRNYLFSKLWKPNYFIYIDIVKLSNRLLLLYYFNFYILKNRTNDLKIEDENYVEFLKLLSRNKNDYFINKEFNNIIFRPDLKKKELEIENSEILYFFNDFKNPVNVNKNVISWFFIIFQNVIPLELHNEFLYIMFGFKKNTIGIVMNLLRKLGKKINRVTEKEKENIISTIKNNYVFRENDNIENMPEIENYINNIILLYKKKEDIDLFPRLLNPGSKDNFFFIQEKNPLISTVDEINFFVQETNKKFIHKNMSLIEIRKIFNTICFNDFENDSVPIVIENGSIINLSLQKIINKNYAINYENNIDKKCLFYTFLKNLFNYEILLANINSLSSIDNYFRDINHFVNLFEKNNKTISFYNGYQKFK